jgi:hypothetical protein
MARHLTETVHTEYCTRLASAADYLEIGKSRLENAQSALYAYPMHTRQQQSSISGLNGLLNPILG